MFGSVERLVAVPALLLAFGIVGAEWIATTKAPRAASQQAMPAPMRSRAPQPPPEPQPPPSPSAEPPAAGDTPPPAPQPPAAQREPRPTAALRRGTEPDAASSAGRRHPDALAARIWPAPRHVLVFPMGEQAPGMRVAMQALAMTRFLTTARTMMPHGAFGFGPRGCP